MEDVDAGRYYLPDAEEGRRETLITSPVDAAPEQCLRVPGPTFVTLWAAAFTGGAFIFPVFHHYVAAGISGLLATATILAWLWTGTAEIPEKPAKAVGLDTTLPLYASGAKSVGWWAMFITMIGDMAAFASLVFGYFYFWTIHRDFPPAGAAIDGPAWLLALLAGLGAWLATLAARASNRRDAGAGFHVAAAAGVVAALVSAAALLLAPARSGMDPSAHVYPAVVWLLSGWTAVHVVVGVLMLLYCIARRCARRMTAAHDIDIRNVALYWHFIAIKLLATVAVVAGFPLLS
jgi:cytochrome c oxidase subunit I+III